MNKLSFNSKYIENLIEQIMGIDTDDLSDDVDSSVVNSVIDEQKTYFWIRLFLKDEEENIEIGDDIAITWEPSGEELLTKFVCFGKSGVTNDQGEQITYYESEDDKRVLCLMIDEKQVNFNDEIPFIRTLFKNGKHYEYQLMRRDELLFINKRNNIILEYYECDF